MSLTSCQHILSRLWSKVIGDTPHHNLHRVVERHVASIRAHALPVGLIGDGVKDGNWDGELFATTPTKDGDTYTWNYSGVELASAGGFKLRTEGTWDDINEGYSDIVAGPDAGDIQDNGGNMQAKADGVYDIALIIDAAAETKSITFTKK